MWNRPCHGSVPINPSSAPGQLPASWTAISYSESTMRRSSSNQRESLLPERSIAPPVLQKLTQWLDVSTKDCSTVGSSLEIGAGENAQINSSVSVPGADNKNRFGEVLPTTEIFPP